MVVKLPGYEVLGGRGSLVSSRGIATQDTTAVGRGLANLGEGIAQAGAHIAKVKDAEGELDVLKARSEYARGRIELEDGFNKDQDWRNYTKRFEKEGDALRDRAASLIRDPKQREVFRLSIADDEAQAKARINSRASALETDEGRAGLAGLLERNKETALDERTDDATRTNLIRDTHAAVDAAERSGFVSAQEAQKLRTNWPREYENVKLDRDIERDVDGADADLGGAAMPQNSKSIRDGLIRRGWSETAAAGITGALMAESRLDPTIGGDKEGGVPTSFGLAQWRGSRLTNLKTFAAAKGKDWTDTDVQLDFLDEELRGKQGDAGAARAGKELEQAQTVDQAAEAMMHFERPRHYTPENPRKGLHFDRRLRNAEAVASGKASTPSKYRFLTEEDKLKARVRIEAKKRQREAQDRADARDAALEQAQVRTARRDSYTLGIEKRTLTDPNQFLDDSTLDDGDKATLLERYKSEYQKDIVGAAAIQAVATAKPGDFNRYDAENRKTVDTAYEATGGATGLLEGEPASVQRLGAIVAQTNIVPKTAVETLRNGLASPTPAVVEQSLNTARALIERDPKAFDGSEGSKDIVDAATRFGHLTREQGVPEQEAAARVKEIINPSDPNRRSVLQKATPATVKATLGKTDAEVANVALEATGFAAEGGGALGWFYTDPTAGTTVGQQTQIAADFKEFFESRFLESGDPADAKRMAAADMKRVYALTRISGKPVLMKYAPELAYPAVGGSHAYLGEQLLEASREVLKDPEVKPEDIALGWTPRTARQFDAFRERGARVARGHPRDRTLTTSGFEPDYQVIVRRNVDGQEVFVPLPGGLFRFEPGKAKTVKDTADEAAFREQREADAEDRAERDALENNPVTSAVRGVLMPEVSDEEAAALERLPPPVGIEPDATLAPGGIQLPGGR